MQDHYDEKMLLDYIEGELDDVQRRQVGQWMQNDAALALMVRQMISDRNELRGLFEPAPPDWVMQEVDQQLERAILLGDQKGEGARFERNQRNAARSIVLVGALVSLLAVGAFFVVTVLLPPVEPENPGGGGVVKAPTPEPDPDAIARDAMLAEAAPPDLAEWPDELRAAWQEQHDRLSPMHMTNGEKAALLAEADMMQQKLHRLASEEFRVVSLDAAKTLAMLAEHHGVQGDGPLNPAWFSDGRLHYQLTISKTDVRSLVSVILDDEIHVDARFEQLQAPKIPEPAPVEPKNPYANWPRLAPDFKRLLEPLVPRPAEPESTEPKEPGPDQVRVMVVIGAAATPDAERLLREAIDQITEDHDVLAWRR